MAPDLFSIGPITLHTYGLFVALGFITAVFLAWRQAGREGIPQDQYLDMAFWIIAGGIVGARVLYVLTCWREYAARPLDAFRLWDGGLVFYGGFALAVFAAVWYSRKQKLPLWKVADVSAPYIPLGHAFGRIGCFFAGCCYGRPSVRCGVVFPALGDHIPRLPTQLYEAGFNLILFGVLLWLRPRRHPAGWLFWLYIALYAAGRFVIEFFRGDEIRGTFWAPWLHTSQALALLALGLALLMLFLTGRRPSVSE